MVPAGFEIDVSQLDVIRRLPLFDQDLETSERIPAEVTQLKASLTWR